MAGRNLRLILNGKKAGNPSVREAVDHVRKLGHTVDVRATWEAGDAVRFAAEALDAGVDVIVAGGGDGTVNEVVNGIFAATDTPESAMGALPLGSANDFATGNGIPLGNPTEALELIATAEPTAIDVGKVNDLYFLNAVIAGFGAEVTFNTSERLKQTIGGAAYALTGFITAIKHTAYKGRVAWDGGSRDDIMLIAAVSNSILGGGFQIAPKAKLDDGLLDVVTVQDFPIKELPTVIKGMQNLGKEESQFVQYLQVPWFDVEAEREIPLAVDGELMSGSQFRFKILKQRLPFILPQDIDP